MHVCGSLQASRLQDYEDVLDARDIYSVLALSAFHHQHYGTPLNNHAVIFMTRPISMRYYELNYAHLSSCVSTVDYLPML